MFIFASRDSQRQSYPSLSIVDSYVECGGGAGSNKQQKGVNINNSSPIELVFALCDSCPCFDIIKQHEASNLSMPNRHPYDPAWAIVQIWCSG